MKEEIMRLSAKGQVTIPVSIRRKMNLHEGDYVRISIEDSGMRLEKVVSVQPLGPRDPIWEMIGKGDSGVDDVSSNHDRYLAEGEVRRWKQ